MASSGNFNEGKSEDKPGNVLKINVGFDGSSDSTDVMLYTGEVKYLQLYKKIDFSYGITSKGSLLPRSESTCMTFPAPNNVISSTASTATAINMATDESLCSMPETVTTGVKEKTGFTFEIPKTDSDISMNFGADSRKKYIFGNIKSVEKGVCKPSNKGCLSVADSSKIAGSAPITLSAVSFGKKPMASTSKGKKPLKKESDLRGNSLNTLLINENTTSHLRDGCLGDRKLHKKEIKSHDKNLSPHARDGTSLATEEELHDSRLCDSQVRDTEILPKDFLHDQAVKSHNNSLFSHVRDSTLFATEEELHESGLCDGQVCDNKITPENTMSQLLPVQFKCFQIQNSLYRLLLVQLLQNLAICSPLCDNVTDQTLYTPEVMNSEGNTSESATASESLSKSRHLKEELVAKCSEMKGRLNRIEEIAMQKTKEDDSEVIINEQVKNVGKAVLKKEFIKSVFGSLMHPLEAMQKCSDIQIGLHQAICTAYDAIHDQAARGIVANGNDVSEFSETEEELNVLEDIDELVIEGRSLLKPLLLASHLKCFYMSNPYSSERNMASAEDRVKATSPQLSPFGPLLEANRLVSSVLVPDGQGKLTGGLDRLIYEGYWKNGKRFGLGKALIVSDSEPSAKRNGLHGIYVGEWLDNMRHGHGRLVFVSGTVYSGEWQRDSISGYGTMKYSDGTVLEGWWHEGKPDGCCEYTWLNGDSEYREYVMGQVLRVVEASKRSPPFHDVMRQYSLFRLKYQKLEEEKNCLTEAETRLKERLSEQIIETLEREEKHKRALARLAKEKVRRDARNAQENLEARTTIQEMQQKLRERENQQEQHSKESQTLSKKVEDLEAKLREKKGSQLCQICFDKERDCIIMPCTHLLYCRICVSKQKTQGNGRCPACRGPISGEINCNIG